MKGSGEGRIEEDLYQSLATRNEKSGGRRTFYTPENRYWCLAWLQL